MDVLIIGYGRMGKAVHTILEARGHRVINKIDAENADHLKQYGEGQVDVAIEFTTPEAALHNITHCLEHSIPVVTGTTGWISNLSQAEEICKANDTAFLYASNFSLGVNMLFALNNQLAQLTSNQPQYTPRIEETHHIHKKDKPSGTAVTLATEIIKQNERYDHYSMNQPAANEIEVKANREGEVFGIHNVQYDSPEDTIAIRHSAKSRKGFALGAVIAAEYIHQRKGVFTMQNVLGF